MTSNLNHGEDCRHVADDTTLMSPARRILKQYRASCRDAASFTVTGLKLHFSAENKCPHAHGRRMKVADPSAGRAQKSIACRCREIRHVKGFSGGARSCVLPAAGLPTQNGFRQPRLETVVEKTVQPPRGLSFSGLCSSRRSTRPISVAQRSVPLSPPRDVGRTTTRLRVPPAGPGVKSR